jgi:hypothetical protein
MWMVCLIGKYGVRSPKFIGAPCAQLYSLAETHVHESTVWKVLYQSPTENAFLNLAIIQKIFGLEKQSLKYKDIYL